MNQFYHTEAYNDKFIIELFKNKKNLFFIEGGAVDGIDNSTCYSLEKNYDWNGICVEANPYNFNKLKKNRKAICINKPLDNISDKDVDFIITKSQWLCGIKEYTLSDPIKLKKFPDAYEIKETIKMKTISLVDLLENNNSPNIIHYLSLDIEGGEYEVLKDFPFDKYKILSISIECPNLKKKWETKFPNIQYTKENEFHYKTDLPCYKLLISKGFTEVKNPHNKTALNEYYFIHKDFNDLMHDIENK